MKKLEELGISPAPWRFADDGMGECDIRCSGVSYGEDYEGDDVIASSIHKKDAPFIAAAPLMYEAVRDLLEIVGNVGEYISVDCATMAKVEKARAALRKASGESEVRQ